MLCDCSIVAHTHARAHTYTKTSWVLNSQDYTAICCDRLNEYFFHSFSRRTCIYPNFEVSIAFSHRLNQRRHWIFPFGSEREKKRLSFLRERIQWRALCCTYKKSILLGKRHSTLSVDIRYPLRKRGRSIFYASRGFKIFFLWRRGEINP